MAGGMPYGAIPQGAGGGNPSTPSPTPTSAGDSTTTTKTPSKFYMTDGWYVGIACIGGVMVANTRIGPLAFGILTVALIFQLNLLLQGK